MPDQTFRLVCYPRLTDALQSVSFAKRLNQNETEQSQWRSSACTCTWTPANVRQFQAQGKRGILTMGDNYKWNNVYSVPCAVYVVQLGTGRQAVSMATRQPGDLPTWEWVAGNGKREEVTRAARSKSGAWRAASMGR